MENVGKTRCFITADDSEDEKIQPEGLKEHKVQPPMPMKPMQAPPVSNSVDPMDEENETNVIEDEVQQEEGDKLGVQHTGLRFH